jgi:hypothetical protein
MKTFCAIAIGCLSLNLSACAGSLHRTNKVATDYNHVFAKSRNEVLLLNVLRAWAREPLQFSTMGPVTGSVRTASKLTIPFNNILLGGDEAINPTLELSGGVNPSVTIIPLSSKEFTQGILRPISPETLDYFLSQRWDRELVLPLVLGGVACSSGDVVVNKGGDPYLNWDFFDAARNARTFSVGRAKATDFAKLRMPAKEAMAFLKEGAGEGRSIHSITAYSGEAKRRADVGGAQGQPGQVGQEVIVEVKKAGEPQVTGVSLSSVCSDFAAPSEVAGAVDATPQGSALVAALEPVSKVAPALDGRARQTALLFRSVESVIYFLAEIHRVNIESELERCRIPRSQDDIDRAAKLRQAEAEARKLSLAQAAGRDKIVAQAASGGPLDLFRVRMACAWEAPALTSFVATEFQGRSFYILPAGTAEEGDRTLEVMSFLSDLIALQTSETLIQSASPIIAIAQ